VFAFRPTSCNKSILAANTDPCEKVRTRSYGPRSAMIFDSHVCVRWRVSNVVFCRDSS
jgi:hypothetical protein